MLVKKAHCAGLRGLRLGAGLDGHGWTRRAREHPVVKNKARMTVSGAMRALWAVMIKLDLYGGEVKASLDWLRAELSRGKRRCCAQSKMAL